MATGKKAVYLTFLLTLLIFSPETMARRSTLEVRHRGPGDGGWSYWLGGEPDPDPPCSTCIGSGYSSAPGPTSWGYGYERSPDGRTGEYGYGWSSSVGGWSGGGGGGGGWTVSGGGEGAGEGDYRGPGCSCGQTEEGQN